MARDKGKHIEGPWTPVTDADRPYFHRLSLTARWAVVEIGLMYWRDKDRRNPVEISARYLSGLIGCNKETAAKALCDLVDAGFLKTVRPGSKSGKRSERTTIYRLTWLNVDGLPDTATFDHRKKNQTYGKSSHQRTENPDVEEVAETEPMKPFKAKKRNGLEVAKIADFSEAPGPMYSQTFNYLSLEGSQRNSAAILSVIERARQSAESIVAEIERRKAS